MVRQHTSFNGTDTTGDALSLQRVAQLVHKLLAIQGLCAHVGTVTDCGLEAAPLLIVPPHLAVREGCVVIGVALVSAVVPFRC